MVSEVLYQLWAIPVYKGALCSTKGGIPVGLGDQSRPEGFPGPQFLVYSHFGYFQVYFAMLGLIPGSDLYPSQGWIKMPSIL